MISALQIYGRALRGDVGVRVRFAGGGARRLPIERYLAPADGSDLQLLDGLHGPVLDVGCGPGRHLRALSARGVFALGVDLSPAAVELARGGGGRAIVGDVFGELPGAGSWRTALLLDGNIGIGGNPVRLLSRLRSLLTDDGVVLVEVEAPGGDTCTVQARIEADGEVSGWFPWARVSASEVGSVAAGCGLMVARQWCCEGRWFAALER